MRPDSRSTDRETYMFRRVTRERFIRSLRQARPRSTPKAWELRQEWLSMARAIYMSEIAAGRYSRSLLTGRSLYSPRWSRALLRIIWRLELRDLSKKQVGRFRAMKPYMRSTAMEIRLCSSADWADRRESL